jgi:hypothetical protein
MKTAADAIVDGTSGSIESTKTTQATAWTTTSNELAAAWDVKVGAAATKTVAQGNWTTNDSAITTAGGEVTTATAGVTTATAAETTAQTNFNTVDGQVTQANADLGRATDYLAELNTPMGPLNDDVVVALYWKKYEDDFVTAQEEAKAAANANLADLLLLKTEHQEIVDRATETLTFY